MYFCQYTSGWVTRRNKRKTPKKKKKMGASDIVTEHESFGLICWYYQVFRTMFNFFLYGRKEPKKISRYNLKSNNIIVIYKLKLNIQTIS